MRHAYLLLLVLFLTHYSQGNLVYTPNLAGIKKCLSDTLDLDCKSEIAYQVIQAQNLPDSSYLAFLYEMCKVVRNTGRKSLTKDRYAFYISEAKRLKITKHEVLGYLGLGTFYRNLNNWEKANAYHVLAVELAKTKCRPLLPQALALHAQYYKVRGMYKEAQKQALEALQIAEKENNNEGKYYAYTSLSGVYNMNKIFNKAYEYCQEASKYSVYVRDDSISYINTQVRAAAILMCLQHFDSAQHILFSLKPIIERRGLLRDLAMCHTHIATTFIKAGNYKNAKNYYNQGLYYAKKADDNVIILYVHRMLSSYYHELKEYDKALEEAQIALKISDKIGVNQNTLQIIETLSAIFKDKGDLHKALMYNEQYYKLRDSLIGVKTRAELLSKEKEMDDAIKLQEIDALKASARIKRTRNAFGFVGLGLLGIVGWLLVRKQRQKLKTNQLITVQREALHNEQLTKEKLEKENITLELEQNKRVLTGKALHIAEKNELLGQLETQLKSINSTDENAVEKILRNLKISAVQEHDWDQFVSVFESVHPHFIQTIKSDYKNLTPSDVRLATLIKMNFNTKQIAAILHISELGVKKARYRLRKKLNLDEKDGLEDFISKIG